ncbi:MAG: hypothetical protein FWH55_04800 [Oscillospiraceae bacterium]|nr:hypothetical protein [Oscillospiraceae bacterium]
MSTFLLSTDLVTYDPMTPIKSELFKPEVTNRRAIAQCERITPARRGESRFAEPTWVAGVSPHWCTFACYSPLISFLSVFALILYHANLEMSTIEPQILTTRIKN